MPQKQTNRKKFIQYLLTVFLLLAVPQPLNAKETPENTQEMCTFGVISSPPFETFVKLDEKKQKINVFTRYGFEEKSSKEGQSIVIVSKISAIVFDDFLKAYNNFLKKRVGPSDHCDKLEIGKVQTDADKNGKALGYFVARYEDRWCLYLKFFDSNPGETNRELFVLSSAKGITGVKNTFTPVVSKKGFSIFVESAYEPIEEPSIFGRGEATLTGLYKEPLTGFLSDKEFQTIVNNLLPENNNRKKRNGFIFTGAGFMKNTEKKIQLTFLSQRKLTKKSACAFRSSLLKNPNWSEKK